MSIASNYDPNAVGVKGSIFGLPFDEEESKVVILPVPWDATVSYSAGTADGPQAILDASAQLDLEVVGKKAPWKRGIWMAPIDQGLRAKSNHLRKDVESYIEKLEQGKEHPDSNQIIDQVNASTSELKNRIEALVQSYIKIGKTIGLLGGDHSCPLGYLEALAQRHDDFGILQIDAHMDLREAYEGFEHSHASIMYNALKISSISKLIQVGIRDFSEAEVVFASTDERIEVFYDQDLKQQQYMGIPWKTLCDQMISALPQKVYISFDIDGLNPHLCPGTGTPVPGGLEYNEAIYLINQIKDSGRQIIGFDLCEVAPQTNDKEWNANVGARVLYALCGVV
ncbi:MAG: agmatinase family protein [Reichenbachiella sp.]|uniref:agmatinase family protein n=1 Tax=Reichenbachiella sp. TaxID=2184521 RepID=UPI0032664D05